MQCLNYPLPLWLRHPALVQHLRMQQEVGAARGPLDQLAVLLVSSNAPRKGEVQGRQHQHLVLRLVTPKPNRMETRPRGMKGDRTSWRTLRLLQPLLLVGVMLEGEVQRGPIKATDHQRRTREVMLLLNLGLVDLAV